MSNTSPQDPQQPYPPQPYPQQNYGQQPPVAPGRPRKKPLPGWLKATGIGFGAFILGIAIGAGSDNTNTASLTPGATVTVTGPTVTAPAQPGQPAPTVTKTVEKPVPGPVKTVTAPPPAAKAAIPEDGVFLVNKDIQPGTYRSSGGDCYWARLKNTSGDFDAIITNGNGGNQTVTIRRTDGAFESSRCAPWTKIAR